MARVPLGARLATMFLFAIALGGFGPKPRYEAEIAAFEAEDKADPQPTCATLFVGSSTIRLWTSLKRDFPTRKVINRGFGGSTVWEIDDSFSRVVAPYRPKEIVYYAGDNDIADNRAPDQVYDDFVRFLELKDRSLGATPVWFISAKPSKLRWRLMPEISAFNAKVKALAARRNDLVYVDVVPAMLKSDGTPKDIFRKDGLHMTPEGYALWTPIVARALEEKPKGKAPGCPA